ncbi:MAG TPA: nitroreductase/quinone reductase family protein [Ktedonobacteraceae bacterium]|nr:nitroreductase/quinone reductase family protein [Ktedonobacteraceae bacterium]
MNWEKMYNPVVIWLLRSPFHGLIDKNTVLITFTGRKSGKSYTFPISYVRDGDTLMMISRKEHTWRKNFRGGTHITLCLQGRTLRASGEVFTDVEIVANKLHMFLRHFPGYQKLMHMKLAADGQPEDPEAFHRFVQSMVIIHIKELVEVAA